MARRVFFSFHYADIMNANIVRMSGEFKPSVETGFYDASLWERAKTQGAAAIQRLIDAGLNNTSVTVFLVGQQTYGRKWCLYERDKSIADRKGLLGIQLPNERTVGPNTWLLEKGIPVYNWDHRQFAAWVEAEARKAGR
jgi:hypothetical protein